VEIQLKQKFQNLPPSLARFALVITSWANPSSEECRICW
jgi:hypothetical protein